MASHKALNLVLVLGAAVVGFLLLRPFLTPLAFAAVLAFAFYKPHCWLRKKITENVSASLLTAGVLAAIIAVVVYGMQTLLNEFAKIYLLTSEINFENLFANFPEFAGALQNFTRLILQKAITWLTGLVTALPKAILLFFIFSVALFFFLKDGERLYRWIKSIFPLPQSKKEHIFRDLEKYSNSLITVWFLIGLIQCFVAIIGFMLFGLPAPFLAGVAAAVLSILPVIGPYTLYTPVAAFLFLRGEPSLALGLLLYGLSIGSFLDYIIRPYFAGKWSAIHPLVMLVGMAGGVMTIGPAGFIIGPAVLLVIISVLHGAGVEFTSNKG